LDLMVWDILRNPLSNPLSCLQEAPPRHSLQRQL
jgi:hypothetical protein